MMKVLAIAFGLLIVVSRALSLTFPDDASRFVKRIAASRPLLRTIGVIAIGCALLIFFAVGEGRSAARWVIGALGVIQALAGLLLVLVPGPYGDVARWAMDLPRSVRGVGSLVGLAFGGALLYVGFTYH